MIDFNQRVTLSTDAVCQEVQGETVIMDLRSSQYFTLDETATRIWQLLKETGNTGAVLSRMLEEYEVSESNLKADIEQLITNLHNEGLIEVNTDCE